MSSSRRRARLLAGLLAMASLAPAPTPAGEKSPAAATGLAIVPGAALHGLGHYYAGDRRTASILFLSEVFGLALLSFDRNTGSVAQRIGDREREGKSGDGLSALGRVLFFGSWLYDMGAAGDAARTHNRRHAQEGFSFEVAPETEGRRVSFNPRARYTVTF